ncbi:MAG: hypothetical protein ACLUEF_02360 [Faecalibacterium prausnitzii]
MAQSRRAAISRRTLSSPGGQKLKKSACTMLAVGSSAWWSLDLGC